MESERRMGRLFFSSARWFFAFCLFVLLAFFASKARAADFCEFADVDQAKSFGWEARQGACLEVTNDCKVGSYALKVTGQEGMGKYGGINLHKKIDLSSAQPGDRITFFMKQNVYTGFYFNITTGAGYSIQRHFSVKKGEWNRVELDLELANWETVQEETGWSEVRRLAIYSSSFDAPGEYLILDGFSITLGGKEISVKSLRPLAITNWEFPYEIGLQGSAAVLLPIRTVASGNRSAVTDFVGRGGERATAYLAPVAQ